MNSSRSASLNAILPIRGPRDPELRQAFDSLLPAIANLSHTIPIEATAAARLKISVTAESPSWAAAATKYYGRWADAYLIFEAEAALDPEPYAVPGSSITVQLMSSRGFAAGAFRMGIADVLLAAALSHPGVLETFRGAVFVDGQEEVVEVEETFSETLSSSVGRAKKAGWPDVRDRGDLGATLSWLSGVPGFDLRFGRGPVGRAVAALTFLMRESGRLALVWAILGLESLYGRGTNGLRQQLVEKSRLVLGSPATHLKMFGRAYDFRSRFLHGDVDIPYEYTPYDGTDEFDKYLADSLDAEELSVAVLIATLQRLVAENRWDLEFDYSRAERGGDV